MPTNLEHKRVSGLFYLHSSRWIGESTHSPAMAIKWLRILLGRYPTNGRWSSLLLASLFRMKGRLRNRPDGPFRSEYIFGLVLESLMMGDSTGQRYGMATV